MAIPYVANVRTEDGGLLGVIKPYVQECQPENITCLVYKSYSAVVQNLSYKTDPYIGGKDYIRTPRQTLKDKGGDCEDLTGVLVSFLANLKVDSYVLMTTDHAYAMGCGISPDQLQDYIREGLERSITRNQKKSFGYGDVEAFYYGLSGNKRGGKMKWDLVVKGKYPFSFLVVPGRVSSTQLRSQRLNYLKECSGINVTKFSHTCELGMDITVIVVYGRSFLGITPKNLKENPGKKNNPSNPIEFALKGNYNLADINQVAVHYYPIKKDGRDTYCVVLEPTAGSEGYPGFSRVKNQWSIAISPTTWDWFYLKNPQKMSQ